MFRAPAGEGEPWKRILRRANAEEEERQIFARAEAALDTEKDTPADADVRASRSVEMLGNEYLKDSIERGNWPRTMEQRESRLNAHILPTIGGVLVAKWRIEPSHLVMEKGREDDLLPARPQGPARSARRLVVQQRLVEAATEASALVRVLLPVRELVAAISMVVAMCWMSTLGPLNAGYALSAA